MNIMTRVTVWVAYVTSILILIFLVPKITHAATTSVIYQSDFASDPHWTTDQPVNFYWDAGEEALFARTYNRPDSAYSPSRYYYTETTLDPKLSYELTWDMQIQAFGPEGSSSSGVALFGLYGDRLNSFNPLNINFVGNDQDGTFTTRLMALDGNLQFLYTEVNPGYNYDIGTEHHQGFDIGVWYSVSERYDALSHTYRFTIVRRDTQELLFETVVAADPQEPVNSALQNLGISMHPEGTGNTQLAYGSRIDGFTEYRIDNVTLTQIYDETYSEPSSVLFLPGIQASRLYREGLFGSEDRLWEPNINGDVAQLAMNENGESVEDVYTRDVIDAAFGTFGIYGSFLTYLESLTTQGIISDWETFAYDWRYAVNDVVQNGTNLESEVRNVIEVVETLARTNNSHVTIIAHSNGGLLAKALIAELEARGKAYLIDRVILLASPQLGTPKAIGSVLHGYDQERFGGLIVDDVTAREVIQNFPGAYGLLPSDAYVNGIDYPILSFGVASTTQHFVDAYGTTIDSPEELADFMRGEVDGRRDAGSHVNEPTKVNSVMYGEARELHGTTLDPWRAPSTIDVIEIVGVGLDTVKGFEYKEFIKRTCIPAGGSVACAFDPYYEPVPQFSQYGDETVMALSAEAYGGTKRVYYIDLNEVADANPDETTIHSNITNLASLQQFLGGLVQNSTPSVPFIYETRPVFDTGREVISVHSPVTLTLTDTQGNFVGKVGDGASTTAVTDIPGSSYLEIGGATYIIVPNTTNYIATVRGIGEEGSYSLGIETLSGEEVPVLVSMLASATVTPDMEATFTKSVGIVGELETDYDGDGSIDQTVQLVPEPTVTELFNALRTMVNGFVLLKVKDRNWLLNALDRAETTGASKGYGSSSVLRIFGQIDAKLEQHVSAGKVSIPEYNICVGFMNEIMTR